MPSNAAPAEPLVEIRDLCFLRGARMIFDHVSLTIPRGQVSTIMGPSGCGKTTLLRIIGGQLRPQSGSVRVAGEEVTRMSRRALMALRQRMGMLFQSGALFTDLSVFDNIAFPLREHTRLPESLVRHVVLMKLEAVGLRGARDLMPSELSGGMARRVALARAVALDPMMILYDEPFTGQDPISMGVLLRLIRLMNDALALTSVVVSHDVHEAAGISHYLYLLSAGHIIAAGRPADIAASRDASVRQFMDALPDGPVRFHYPAPDLRTDFLGQDP
ncbi:MAG: ABC transporter ATP-binding protein [Gammaproteobacteria bacterium]